MPSARSHWPPVAAGALAVAALIAGISHVAWPWMVDDAFISLRFAERLVAGHGLTWTDGERVEGYSNLLWVLLTSGCLLLGIDGMTAVRGLGIACTAGTFAVLLGSRLLPAVWPAPLAVVVLASIGATPTWAIGGLEAPLMMLLVAIAMANVVAAVKGPVPGEAARARWHLGAAGIALALAACTRVDGLLWTFVAAVAVVAFAPRGTPPHGAPLVRQLRWLLMIPFAAVLAQLVFRAAYYGDWLPNTGRAKAAWSAASLAAGAGYVAAAAVGLRALLLPAVLGAARALKRAARPAVLLCVLGASTWWLYILQIGGDAFPRSRLLVPSLVPLTVLAAHGFAVLAATNRAGRLLAWLAAVGCVVLATWDARRPTSDARQQLTHWEWFGKATGEWLGRAFAQQQPLLAVDAAGAGPYFSRLPSLDMLGLCDRTIAATPFPREEAFVPGHSRANGAYVLSRQPDLVLFGLPPGTPQPQWLGGRQLERDERFLADYRVVLFHMGAIELPDGSRPDLGITAWVRLDGRLGPRADANAEHRIVLPGFWLGSHRQPYSFLSPPASMPRARVALDVEAGARWWQAAAVVGVWHAGRDAPVAEVRRPGRHVVPELPLAAGRYRVLAEGLPSGVTLALADANGRSLAAVDAWVVAGAAGELRAVDLVCDVPPDVALPFVIDHFVLERLD